MKEILIVGDSSFAEIAYEYFTHDSDFEVKGFVLDRPYINSEEKFGLPIVAFDELEQHFDPETTGFHVAIPYANMNEVRSNFINRMKLKKYSPVSYISSESFVWPNVNLGQHIFIFENNTVQPYSQVGENTIIWSGNHIGHHSIIGNNVFVSSHVVLSGHCQIGNNTFIGVNATIANNVNIAEYNWIGMGASIGKSTSPYEIYKAEITKPQEKDVRGIFLK